MILKTNFKKVVFFIAITISTTTPTQAQFWKKLKKKVQQKVEQKIEKETDKAIDKTLEGKSKKEAKEKKGKKNNISDNFKSSGVASINHANEFGLVNINKIAKVTINKEGNSYRITGNWITTGIDVFDGFNIVVKNVNNEAELNTKTFKIPEEATLNLGYETQPQGSYKGESSGKGQGYSLNKGTINLNFQKDKTFSFSFSGDADLTVGYKQSPNGDYQEPIKQNVAVSGNANVNNPKYTVTKSFANNNKKDKPKKISDAQAREILNKVSPTVNIPGSFSFNKSIQVEITDNRGDKYPLEFLLGNYPDIYGMSVASKEMQGQGEVTMVTTPKTSTMFMNVAGMKMKKSSSIDQMGDQYNMSKKLPDGADFEYKKTGKTKSIAGYNCEEYRVDYYYTNSKGSASFWVSKDFPIQNMEMPMLGMKLNNPYLKGFVLEIDSNHQGQNWIIKVTNVSNKNVTINTSEYRKMGF